MLIAVCALVGLVVGSFLNVVIGRVPAGESVVSPGSRCPACGVPIEPRDNVPVLSWAVLRGRARCCGSAISARYPLVEAGTALIFASVAWWVQHSTSSVRWPLSGSQLPAVPAVLALLGLLYLAAAGIALGLIDIDTFRLPFWIVVPSWYVVAALLGGAALVAGQPRAAGRMLLGGLALWLFYRALHQIYPRGMGYGDVRLAGLIGGFLAWWGWDVLIVGAALGVLVGGIGGAGLVLLRGGGRRSPVPFGPYMLVGSWLGAVFGHSLAQAYLSAAGL